MKHPQSLLVLLLLAACTNGGADAPARTQTPELGRSVSAQGQPASQPVVKRARDAGERTLTRTLAIQEGAGERTLWISDEVVAEAAPSDSGRERTLRVDPSARLVEQKQAGVRLWRVESPLAADLLTAKSGTEAPQHSPVFHLTSSPDSPKMALPGGVVATFPRGWDRARVDGWLADRGLAAEHEIGEGMNMFLVGTPPGLAALETSNRLAATGELVDCEPNWWREVSTR